MFGSGKGRFGLRLSSTPPNTAVTSFFTSQLEGRINRIGSLHKEIEIITLHCGILSYILENYENAKSLEMAIKQFAKNIKDH